MWLLMQLTPAFHYGNNVRKIIFSNQMYRGIYRTGFLAFAGLRLKFRLIFFQAGKIYNLSIIILLTVM